MHLPADSHVHSEWSWDTGGPQSDASGRMQQTCARAEAIGLSALVFTEHLDFDARWRTTAADLMPNQIHLLSTDGYVRVPILDLDGYLDSIERCRHRFPELQILTGVEFGQPHLYEAQATQLRDLGVIDRVLGSLHALEVGEDRSEPNTLFRICDADEVMWAYLEEIPRMVAGSRVFEVFTHIDYAVRAWPTESAGPFDPRRFEKGLRNAMRAIANSDRTLEMNTRRLWPWIPQWWSEEGGKAVTFGSDAHVPEALAANFPEATAMLEHYGFRPGQRPEEYWTR